MVIAQSTSPATAFRLNTSASALGVFRMPSM